MGELTYKQATAEAIELRKQGKTYPEIEKYLKEAGYVSPFTRKPVGHLAVRNMVVSAIKEREEAKAEKAPPLVLSAPKQELLDQIQRVCTMDFPVDLRLEMVKYLLAQG